MLTRNSGDENPGRMMVSSWLKSILVAGTLAGPVEVIDDLGGIVMRLVNACLWMGVVSGLLVFASEPISGAAAADSAPPTVRLVIDYGDGVQKHFTKLPWKEGATVLDALQGAANHRRGIEFKHRGTGATAFVTQIDDLKNEGRHAIGFFA